MNKDKKHDGVNSKKESLAFAIQYGVIGIIWTLIQKQYRIRVNLNYIYVLITSTLIYIVAYNRFEKTKRINRQLRISLEEIAIVNEEKQSCEISLQNQLFMTESFIREINLGIISLDRSLNITSVNPYFLEITKYEEQELIMKNVEDIFIEDEDANYSATTLEDIINLIKARNNIMRIKSKDGDILEFSTYNMAVEDSSGDISEVLTFAVDITEKNKLEKKLRHLAYYDDLTGLPNKHLLRNYLEGKSIEKDRKFAILYVEIDDYKITNESLGHKEAESLLKKVSNIISISLKKEDYLARISENEFIIFINDNVNKKELEDKSQEILNKILDPIQINRSKIHLSAKIGISTYPYISKSLDELLKDAHLAVHHVRYESEKHYAFFNREIGDKINKENYIIKELEKAIENKEFIPHFQPISYIENNEIVGFETLIRWLHPEEGFISPGEFIPIAEETGQIYKITDIMLDKALSQKQIWNDKGYRHYKMSVNISSKSFEKENLELELKILELLRKYDIEPEELILEITETAAIKYKEIDDIYKMFNRFKGMGIEMALDDFGTGNSSLARLNALPIKYLKIDGSFVSNISENGAEQAIVKAVIDLAETLELSVIAEGIETLEQSQSLLNIGCKIGQGYYLARPAPAEEIEKMFHKIN